MLYIYYDISSLRVKVSVPEPSDAVNAGMATQTEGHRLALSLISSPSAVGLVGFDQETLHCSGLMTRSLRGTAMPEHNNRTIHSRC